MIGILIGVGVFLVAVSFYCGMHFGQAMYDKVDEHNDRYRTATW